MTRVQFVHGEKVVVAEADLRFDEVSVTLSRADVRRLLNSIRLTQTMPVNGKVWLTVAVETFPSLDASREDYNRPGITALIRTLAATSTVTSTESATTAITAGTPETTRLTTGTPVVGRSTLRDRLRLRRRKPKQ